MTDKYFWITLVGIAVSFAGGFLLANTLNRNEITALQAQVEQAKKNPAAAGSTQAPGAQPELTDAEIRQKIAEADNAPDNIAFQRDLGSALYRYGGMKQDPNLITESVRLLKRVIEKNPTDYEAIVATGNALFDIAAMRKDAAGYAAAREFYSKALELRPNDAGVRADYGSTYFLGTPVEIEKAKTELEKALAADSANERALQFLTQVYVKIGNKADAEKTFAILKTANPNNPMIPTLTNQIATGRVTE
jgi:tetratricopeptide (TPR) repeat protein